ncbi:MAG: D-glucuronyl C5-epimerase family protein [Rhizomicrobium sp.]|jgi:hypothetical protein
MRRLSQISQWLFGAPGRHSPRPAHWPRGAGAPIDPARVFSPDPALIESYTKIDGDDVANVRRERDNLVFYKDIPYSPYLGEWQFHPNRIGGYLAATKISPALIRTATRLLDCCVELPNGGLALYYPKTIRTARLQVNDPIYSAMAQAQLLAGYTKLARDAPESAEPGIDWRDVAARLATAMTFPFEKGGVCVDGSVLLETPNFRACPETILNGWMDALIHLYDYLCLFPNREMEEFYRRNLEALCEMLPVFDDADARLSRYSNLCPYEFRIHFNASLRGLAPHVMVEYVPRDARHGGYCIEDLWFAEETPRNCIYENKIAKTRSSYMDVSLSASSLYDTKIHVAADCRRIAFDPGSFDDSSTVPRRTLQRRTLLPDSPYDGNRTVFRIAPARDGLLAGCPTNFMKDGRNFYHVYHVVALYELALGARVPEQKKILIDMAARWHDYIVRPARHRAESGFSDPDSFVKKITRFRANRHAYNFEELRRAATG